MTEIPKIGLQRMQQGADLQAHPDAELITAFVENSMNTGERTVFLDHLAQCYECREIVSLASPEHMQVVATPRAPSRWLSWPALRWVGAAVCVVVVGTAVTLHYESRSRSAEVAVEPTEVATLDVKVAPKSPVPAVEQPTKQGGGGANADLVTAPVRQKKAIEGTNNNSVSINQTVMPHAAVEPKPQLQSSETLESRTAPAAAPPATDEIVPGRAKEAEPATAMEKMGAGQQRLALSGSNAAIATRAKLLPRWALTSDGILQRSLDAGVTWETVSVASQSRLLALAANGFDIWVGGSSGALFHSVDAGQHWSQVRAEINGEALSADVIGVEFLDPQHGKISTSALETWTTDDAGQHWQKQ